MGKRKLTQKSLDELAEMMPVLSEREQQEYIGGSIYFTPDGVNLGQFGPGYDIRVVDQATFNKFQYGGGSGLYGQSQVFSLAGEESMGNILNTIAINMGISSGVQLSDLKNPAYGGSQKSGVITINLNGLPIDSGNYYQFESIIQHERIHMNTRTMGGNFKSEYFCEYVAYREQTLHSSFQYLPENVKNVIKSNMNYCKDQARKQDKITDFAYTLPLGGRG